jgi:hypothetical protein
MTHGYGTDFEFDIFDAVAIETDQVRMGSNRNVKADWPRSEVEFPQLSNGYEGMQRLIDGLE